MAEQFLIMISPLLANLYLHDLDEFVQQKGWGWVRYADDYLIQVKDEQGARQADQEITRFVEQSLGLRLNANENPVASLEQGFTFLGVSFKGAERQIAAKKIAKMNNKVAWLLSEKNKAGLEKILRDLGVMIDGWQKYYGFLNPVEQQFALLEKTIAGKFTELARQRIESRSWPKKPLAVLKSFAKYKERRGNSYTQEFAGARNDLEATAVKIKALKPDGKPEDFRNSLMGLEGSFAAQYWRLIEHIIPEEYGFQGRTRQGATDLVNSLLNYGYGILYAQALTAVTKAGLNAMSGFLHAGQGKKPVLTFDLVEEFRAPVVDRAIFSMLNRREQLGQEDNGLLDKETRKKVAAVVTGRLGSEAMHRGKKDTIKNILHGQALSIRDFLSGKSGYKPFLSRW